MPITLLFTVIFKIFVIFLLFARLLYLLIEESSYIPVLSGCVTSVPLTSLLK